MDFYVYLWFRADGLTPYYVGKGRGRRAFSRWSRGVTKPPADKNMIQVIHCGTEADAFKCEQLLIEKYGRKDLGTGCLHNLTDGGEGASGNQHTIETRQRMSKSRMGHSISEETRRKISAAQIGKVIPAGQRAKMSKAKKGKPGHHALKGRPAHNKGVPMSVEQRNQLSGIKKSQAETIAKRVSASWTPERKTAFKELRKNWSTRRKQRAQ
jgi:hypothetical protein